MFSCLNLFQRIGTRLDPEKSDNWFLAASMFAKAYRNKYVFEAQHEKTGLLGFRTRSDTNQAVQL